MRFFKGATRDFQSVDLTPVGLMTYALSWTLHGSPSLNPSVFPLTGKQYTGEQIRKPQVKMIMDLIVRRATGYTEVLPNKIFKKYA